MSNLLRLQKLIKQDTDECIEWTRAVSHGYGVLRKGKKVVRAHRESFLMVNGYLPEVVLHKCDNPKCVNPKHLLGGTQIDNVQDTVTKNRQAKGRRHGNPYIDVDIVKYMYNEQSMSQSDIARKLSVHPSTISKIVNNKARVYNG